MGTTQKDFIIVSLDPGEILTYDNPVLRVPHIIICSQSSGDMRPAIDQITPGSIRVTNPSLTQSCDCVLFVWFWFSTTGSQPAGYTTQVIYAGDLGSGGGEQVPTVLSRSDTPPGAPVDGDRYLVIATAGGAWTGHEDNIAEWEATSASWVFTAPTEGDLIVVDDEQSVYIYHVPTGWELTTPLLHDMGDSLRHSSVGQPLGSIVEADGAGGVQWAIGSSSPVSYIYVDAAAADDSKIGFGTSNPALAANWTNALKTLNAAAAKVRQGSRTYIITRGAMSFTRDAFPYLGFVGECIVVSNDAWTEVATGAVAAYTSAPAKTPSWPEITVNWAGGYVPTDVDIRRYFLEVQQTSLALAIFKGGGYTVADSTHQLLVDLSTGVLPATGAGKTVRLVRPSTPLTIAPVGTLMCTIFNTMFVGYQVNTNAAVIYFFSTSGRYNDYSLDSRCGFAMCEVQTSTYYEMRWYGWHGECAGALEWQDIASLMNVNWWIDWYSMPGIWYKGHTSGSLTFYQVDGRIALSVIEATPVGPATGLIRFEGVRLVDSSSMRCRVHPFADAVFAYSKMSKIWLEKGAQAANVSSAVSSGAGGTDALLEMWPGSSLEGHVGVLYAEGNGAATRRIAKLDCCTTKNLKITGGFATAAGALDLVDIIGGDHGNLQLEFTAAGLDRGVGPLAKVEGNANVELTTCKGLNSNGGAGYGLQLDDPSFAKVTAANATMVGSGGAGTAVKVGSLAVQAWPAAGNRVIDIATGSQLKTV